MKNEITLMLLRHGRTAGNEQRRYVGSTDEPLCQAGVNELRRLRAEERELLDSFPLVYTSPMLRCRQSAGILFPYAGKITADGLSECDFGEFEYKNYEELDGDARYQAWIDSGGEDAFPGGESRKDFQRRVLEVFDEILRGIRGDRAAVVCHGGCIMSVMDRYSRPHRNYFDWQLPCAGYVLGKWIPDACCITVLKMRGRSI